MIKAREFLIYYAYIHKGNWDAIYDEICGKTRPKDEDILNTIKGIKANCLTIVDDEYPKQLKDICKPPFVLFYYGDISLLTNVKNNLGVVGSRKPTYDIRTPTRIIIKEVSEKLTIVSGLAYGIDSIAHGACLSAGGKTIAVLGNGIEYTYLEFNEDLYKEIKKKGLIVSEYPDYTQPTPECFPFRNRIIAGISNAILVPDINIASGTYSTLSYTLNLGKSVYVLPHLPLSTTLNNTLIKEGAILVSTSQDILDEWK